MTRASTPPGAPGQDAPAKERRRASKVPIWVRVSVITAVVLVGVLVSTMLLAASGIGESGGSNGGHGSRGATEMDSDDLGNDHGSGGSHGSGSSPGSSGDHSGGDHPSGASHTSGHQTG